MKTIESKVCFGGEQRVVEHDSSVLGCMMRFGVFLPPGADDMQRPVLFFLSGLTCTEQNVITKAGAQRYCAEHGLILVAPDTSPRGDDVADAEGYDLGKGAGFYLTATQEPWCTHYRMDQYVTEELPSLMSEFTKSRRFGITGHSMGGHGALVLALRNPGLYLSASAFAPILTPSAVPWGKKAFSAYLGDDEDRWSEWDATALIAKEGGEKLPLLIDQGSGDSFLAEQLPSAPFLAAAERGGHPVSYRLQPGYDHSYYFIATFMGDHVAHHAAALNA